MHDIIAACQNRDFESFTTLFSAVAEKELLAIVLEHGEVSFVHEILLMKIIDPVILFEYVAEHCIDNLRHVEKLCKAGTYNQKFMHECLSAVCLGGNLEFFKRLRGHATHPHVHNNACMVNACIGGHLDIVKYLHELGTDIRIYNDACITYAVQYGHLHVVEYLYEHGADIRVHNDACLIYAAQQRHFNIVKWLINHGLDITRLYCLNVAVFRDDPDIIKFLTEHGF